MNIGFRGQGGVRVVRDEHRVGTVRPCRVERPADVGGRPARGNADGHIVWPELRTGRGSVGTGILGVLDGVDQGRLTTSDVSDDPARLEVERRQEFARVEDSQPSRGARAEVVDTTASAHAVSGNVDEFGQLRQGSGDRIDDGVVLRVEDLEHPEGVEVIESGACRIALFGRRQGASARSRRR